MSTTLIEPKAEPKPVLADVPPQWPPVQHIIHNKDKPAREGTIALCGAKLMGMDLGRLKDVQGEVCLKCAEAFLKHVSEQNL